MTAVYWTTVHTKSYKYRQTQSSSSVAHLDSRCQKQLYCISIATELVPWVLKVPREALRELLQVQSHFISQSSQEGA